MNNDADGEGDKPAGRAGGVTTMSTVAGAADAGAAGAGATDTRVRGETGDGKMSTRPHKGPSSPPPVLPAFG